MVLRVPALAAFFAARAGFHRTAPLRFSPSFFVREIYPAARPTCPSKHNSEAEKIGREERVCEAPRSWPRTIAVQTPSALTGVT
jgi:hypothetical protein